MIYKVGDRVKYNGGDLWFYGTVKAVIDTPIGLSYRINVDRIENRNCNTSVTQLGSDISADETFDKTSKTKPKREATTTDVVEETVKSKKNAAKPSNKKRGKGTWEDNFERYKKGERNPVLYNWVAQTRERYAKGELNTEQIEKLTAIEFPFESNRKKKNDAEAVEVATEKVTAEQPE